MITFFFVRNHLSWYLALVPDRSVLKVPLLPGISGRAFAADILFAWKMTCMALHINLIGAGNHRWEIYFVYFLFSPPQ